MKKLCVIVMAAFTAVLTGCFTCSETERPAVRMTDAPADKDVKVAISGFAATVTEYIPIYGHETYFVDRPPRRGPNGRYYGGGSISTSTSTTLIPQTRADTAFVERAQSIMEECGFILRAPSPDYVVDVKFSGPFTTTGEAAAAVAWFLFTATTTEYSAETWSAKLKIYDNKTGRVIFHNDYEQKFENYTFSPLLFIGLAGNERGSHNFMQSWCLTALTDRAIADATAFLSTKGK